LHKEQDLVNLLQELLSQANLDNRARLQQIVLEEKVSMESSLASSGHTYSLIRLKSMFNSTGGVVETWHGITQLEFLRSIANDFETHWEELKNGLITIQNYLLSQKPIVNLTLSKTDYTKVETILSSFVELFDGQSVGPYLTHNFTQIQTNQGWSISTQVNFVGLGLDLYQAGYDYDGSIFPILQNIRTGYLWDKIRVQGGAYGAMVKFDPMNGFLGLVSYRDPNLLQTINHYQGLPDFLTDQDLHTNELVKNIIGAIGDMDRFMLPNTKGYVSMWRHLLGITEEILQRDREAILTTNPADYKQLAAILKKAVSDGRVVVLGNKESLDGVVQAKPGWMDLRKLQ
jgi:Zn-dependent M16 (insulinase) family peptidase